LVFVVGTTNFVESLDPALLRPGRFEFHLHIPYPDQSDRREILKIYHAALSLGMNADVLEYAVKRTGEYVEGAVLGTRFSGDHINALCRALARIRLREKIERPTTTEDIERALTEWIDRPKMTSKEQQVVATHEAGHAVCALFCEHATPIERISIQGDAAGALGFVQYQDPAHKYVVTRGQLLDDLCILMGGREAEQLLLDDLSIGSSDDLRRATNIARALVEEFGMGGESVGVCRFESEDQRSPGRFRQLSPKQLESLDNRVRELLEEGRLRAAAIVKENQALVETLRDLLLQHKVIDAKTLTSITGKSVGPN
jgi:cell division protease FtsH